MRLFGFVFAIGLMLAPLAAQAQQMQERKAAKVGFLIGGTVSSPSVQIEPFKQTLRERGGSRDRISRWSIGPRTVPTIGFLTWQRTWSVAASMQS